MLKALLIASATLAAAPVLAQTTPAPNTPAPQAPQSAPQPPAPAAAAPDPAADPVEVKTNPPTPPAPAPTPGPPSAADTKEELERKAQPTPPDTVATVVRSEFPANDLDADGKLSRAEFAQWMVRLKAKSDPSARAEAPATKAWVAGAWRTADKDKSASVTVAELTRFLTKGRS